MNMPPSCEGADPAVLGRVNTEVRRMGYISLREPHQVTTRKPHRCGWCDELIPRGTAGIWAQSYIFEDGPQSDWMHPECFNAMGDLDREDLSDGWMPGDFLRGSTEYA